MPDVDVAGERVGLLVEGHAEVAVRDLVNAIAVRPLNLTGYTETQKLTVASLLGSMHMLCYLSKWHKMNFVFRGSVSLLTTYSI